jgi:hypothetical protein
MLIDNRLFRYAAGALAALVLCSGGAMAATVAKDKAKEKDKDAPTIYHLEVVLFRNTNPQSLGDERWPEEFGVGRVDRLVHVTPVPVAAPAVDARPTPAPAKGAAAKPAATTPPAEPDADWFHFLGQREFKLSGTVAKLARLPGYEVMLHTAWQQPAFEFQESAAAYVFDGMLFPEHPVTEMSSPFVTTPVGEEAPSPEFNPPRFSGLVKLASGRYLHAGLDVILRGIGQRAESVNPDGNLIEYPRNVIQGYHLNELRRVKIGEVHYFDHPAFGALVLVAATEKKGGADVEKETVGDAPIPATPPDD